MVVTTHSGVGRVTGINVPRDAVEVTLESGAVIMVPVREIEGYEDRTPPTPIQSGQNGEGCGKPNSGRHRHRAQPV
jgi:hypothetical protein